MNKNNGHTILEIMISTVIFTLILATITSLLDVGLKTWQIGETSTDTQNSAEVALLRLKSELKLSSAGSVCKSNSQFISFDSAMNEQGVFQIDPITRTPLWQAHIIYYIYRANGGDKYGKLYRRRVSHTSCTVPTCSAFDSTGVTPLSDDRIMARSVKTFEITNNNDLVNIHLICARNVGDRKLPYAQDFDPNVVQSSMELYTSISPRN